MTVSSASKLMNFRSPALQNLIRRNLLRPPAASTRLLQSATRTNPYPVPDAHFVDPRCRPSIARNFNVYGSNPPLWFNASFRFSVMQFDAARELVSFTREDAGSESGALASDDAYRQPKGRKASYDSDSSYDSEDSDDPDLRDSYDRDAYSGDASYDDDTLSEGDYTEANEFEEEARKRQHHH